MFSIEFCEDTIIGLRGVFYKAVYKAVYLQDGLIRMPDGDGVLDGLELTEGTDSDEGWQKNISH